MQPPLAVTCSMPTIVASTKTPAQPLRLASAMSRSSRTSPAMYTGHGLGNSPLAVACSRHNSWRSARLDSRSSSLPLCSSAATTEAPPMRNCQDMYSTSPKSRELTSPLALSMAFHVRLKSHTTLTVPAGLVRSFFNLPLLGLWSAARMASSSDAADMCGETWVANLVAVRPRPAAGDHASMGGTRVPRSATVVVAIAALFFLVVATSILERSATRFMRYSSRPRCDCRSSLRRGRYGAPPPPAPRRAGGRREEGLSPGIRH